jgi:hypothetical protein
VGKFAAAFALTPAAPGGNLYIRAELIRYGGGSNPSNVALDATGLGAALAGQYYAAYPTNRAGLAALYRDNSQMTFENKELAVGAAAIVATLSTMPAGPHNVQTIDAVPVAADATLVLTTGFMALEEGGHPMPFAHVFELLVVAGAAYVSNELFGFNYG